MYEEDELNDLFARCTLTAEPYYQKHDASHDLDHALRVRTMVLYIGQKENVNSRQILIAELAAIFHDCIQDKTSKGEDVTASAQIAHDTICKLWDNTLAEEVYRCIREASYDFREERIKRPPEELPAALKLLHDADMLDAIGAIGVGRAFSYTGRHGGTFHDVVAHYRKKLLTLYQFLYYQTSQTISFTKQ